MQIRRLSADENDQAVDLLCRMVTEMQSYGGLAVREREHNQTWFRQHLDDCLKRGDFLFLAAVETNGRLIGLLEASLTHPHAVFQPAKILHFHALYVQPEHRRQGIGENLLRSAMQWGREKGCHAVELNVLKNSPARELYLKLGFTDFQIEMRSNL